MNIFSAMSRGWLLALPLVMLLAGCGGSDEPQAKAPVIRPVKAIQLAGSSETSSIKLPGVAQAARDVDLSFRVGGPLIELAVDTGEFVKKGQVVARIDPRDFQVRVKTMKAQLDLAKARLEEAELQFKRYSTLMESGSAAKATYDSSKAAYEIASAQVEAGTKSLEQARNAQADTRLTAPFDGYVHHIYVENHESVQPGQAVCSLVDLAHMEVQVPLPASYLGHVDRVKGFRCTFDALPGKAFSASFKEVGKQPNQSNSTYPLILSLEEAAGELVRPGMAAEVSAVMNGGHADGAFVVPISSLLAAPKGGSRVWIFDPGTGQVSSRPVEIRGLQPGGARIGGDLAPGQWLVVAGVHYLKENQKVSLLKGASASNVGGEY